MQRRRQHLRHDWDFRYLLSKNVPAHQRVMTTMTALRFGFATYGRHHQATERGTVSSSSARNRRKAACFSSGCALRVSSGCTKPATEAASSKPEQPESTLARLFRRATAAGDGAKEPAACRRCRPLNKEHGIKCTEQGAGSDAVAPGEQRSARPASSKCGSNTGRSKGCSKSHR